MVFLWFSYGFPMVFQAGYTTWLFYLPLISRDRHRSGSVAHRSEICGGFPAAEVATKGVRGASGFFGELTPIEQWVFFEVIRDSWWDHWFWRSLMMNWAKKLMLNSWWNRCFWSHDPNQTIPNDHHPFCRHFRVESHGLWVHPWWVQPWWEHAPTWSKK